MNKKSWIALYLLIILALLVTSCSGMAKPEALPQSAPGESAGVKAPVREAVTTNNTSYSQQVPDAKRLVITNANISLAVDDPQASMGRISAMAEAMGGFVVTSSLSQTRLESGLDVPQASITIRVPAEKLKEAMDRIRSETNRPVVSENTQSQDVTKEYTDLQSRLRNLEAAQARLQNIMDSTNKTEDVLAVYRELNSVNEQIEVIKGQIQYYEQSAALSAIAISLLANAAVQPLSIGGWQPAGVARNAIQALINGLKILATIGIWGILFFLPLLIVIALPWYVLYRLLRRRRKARPQPPTPLPGV